MLSLRNSRYRWVSTVRGERQSRAAIIREYVAEVTRLGLAEISPRADALTKAMTAMVTPGFEAGRLYESALNHPGLAGFPFDHARVALAHGRWLRRQRLWSAARMTLDLAAGIFDRLGAASWADQARAELRAAKGSTERSLGAAAALSSQEFQIAELAAAGLTTRTSARYPFIADASTRSNRSSTSSRRLRPRRFPGSQTRTAAA